MDIVRRKVERARAAPVAGPGAGAAWRLALARAARDSMALTLDVTALREERVSLAEVIELPEERSLLAVLDVAGGEGLGLITFDAVILAGMIGMLTTGRIAPPGAEPRRPTRTDAAMVAPLIDAALSNLAEGLAGQEDAGWAAGWRYASFLEEARPLALLLEDVPYRLLRAEVSLMRGAAVGTALLLLPGAARSRLPPPAPAPEAEAAAFRAAFQRQVEGVAVRIEAELTRASLPLARALALQVGEVLPLGDATLARLALRGVDGRLVAEGKLGQMRGQRAVRLTLPPEEAGLLSPD